MKKVGSKTNRSVFIPKVDACCMSSVLSETSPALFRGVVILVVLSKRRVKKRRSLTEYVRAARKWR